jgi:hypothetical protein
LIEALAKEGALNKQGKPIDKGYVYRANNRVYLGEAVHKGTAHQGEHEAIIDRGLWDRVHAIVDPRLARGPYHTSAWAHTRPVEGLDFRADGRSTGAAMTPTHTRKNGRLYRYYVASDVIRTGNSPSPIRRVPAAQIEDAVITQIRTLVQTPEIDPAAGYGLQRREGCSVSNQTPSLPPQLPSTSQ